jgi:hypothetical protein
LWEVIGSFKTLFVEIHMDISDELIKLISYKQFPLNEALFLAKETKYKYSFVGAIVQREDCSIEQALDLAKKTKLDSGVVRAIVQREDYTFEQALDLAKKTRYDSGVIRTIVQKKDFQ